MTTSPTIPTIKQPSEVLVQLVAVAGLGASVITSIVAATVTARGRVPQVAALTINAQAIAPTGVKLTIAGGTDGETYLLTVRAGTDDGRSVEAEAEVHVLDLSYAAPDGSAAYVSVQQFVDRLGIDELVRLTDEAGTGRIDVPHLLAAAIDASAIAETYLAAKFLTPIAPVPQLLTTLVLDLAHARLYRGTAPDGVAAAAAAAMKLLRDMASGTATLPGAALIAAAAASPTPVLFQAPDRRMSRAGMGGY